LYHRAVSLDRFHALHLERDRAESFGSVAEQYDRYRPAFPGALLDDLAAAGRSPDGLGNRLRARAQESLLSGRNDSTTSYMPGSNFAIVSASCKYGSGAGSLRIAS
jgi:hypothetical protein